MGQIRSYPKVWQVGHPAVKKIFLDPVYILEKLDGSQMSVSVIDGKLFMKSKKKELFPPVEENLFKDASETFFNLFKEGRLQEGWIYRGEAIWKPRHNTLKYDRTPKGNIVLFDIDIGLEDRLLPYEAKEETEKLGLEFAPIIHYGKVGSIEELKGFLDMESFLGGPKVEGIVIKNYERWSEKDGKQLMAKLVSQKFKEKHQRNWKGTTKKDILGQIIESLRTEQRWEKAIQHLREAGELQEAVQDIGPLIKEVKRDVMEEEEEWIKEKLFNYYKGSIERGVAGGLPQWYKEKLLEGASFEGE